MSEEGHKYFFGQLPEMPYKKIRRERDCIQQVEILHGQHNLYINFRDKLDVSERFTGRVYKNPTISSMERLAKTLPKYCDVTLIRDGMTFIFVFNRKNLDED
jgi:hypothetical protein